MVVSTHPSLVNVLMLVCVFVCVQIFLHIFADTVTVNHQTMIQFPCGEFYYMGTLSEFAIVSLWSYVRA